MFATRYFATLLHFAAFPQGACVALLYRPLAYLTPRTGFRPAIFGRPTGSRKSHSSKTAWLTIDGNERMKILSFIYRALSNFVFLLLVYYSLNFLDKYQQRAIVAILVLVYSATRAATALRSFYFFQRIERLEGEARRLVAMMGEGPAAAASRKHIVSDVSVLRRAGEMNTYLDLLFLALIVLLCISKIVTE
jgi:hypothetical protein